MEKFSYVYIMGSSSRRALYVGVTGPLYKRIWEHKNNRGGYFTSKYKCDRLLYFEQFHHIKAAIAREKELKGWRRKKKEQLIESTNPEWKDLAADWYPKELMKDGVPIRLNEEHKIPPPYSPADDRAGSLNGRRDDEV